MNHNKHRLYQLLSEQDNFSTVLDINNNTTHTCFLTSHQIGDEFYLYEKEVNIFNGKTTFDYSILNLYEEGRSYTFDIVSETDRFIIVSNYERLNYAAPIKFKTSVNQKEIELEIYALDLDNNKLKFKNVLQTVTEQKKEEVDLDVFEEGKNYEVLLVNTFLNKNQNLVAVVDYDQKQYYVSVPNAIEIEQLGDTLTVYLGKFKDGTPSLKLTRKFIVDRLYEIGNQYSFIIEKQVIDQDSGFFYWILKDKHGMHSNYHPMNDFSFEEDDYQLKEGNSIELYVKNISGGGYLHLVCDIRNGKGKNYLVEEVFQAIGYVDREEDCFFSLLSNLTKEETDLNDSDSISYIEQYNEGENLWVFSYLSFLDKEIFNLLDEGAYQKAKELIDIYIRIEEWILEGSDYLQNFSTHKIQDIILKAEHKIKKLKALIEAIDLYLNDKDLEFLVLLEEQLTRSPYLREEKLNVFKELARVSQFFSSDSDNQLLYKIIVLLIKQGHIVEHDRWHFIKTIESNVFNLRGKVVELLNANNSKEINQDDLEILILNQYLLSLLYSLAKNELKASISSVNLLRYLSYSLNDVEYLDLGIELLIKQGYLGVEIIRNIDIFNREECDINAFRRGVIFVQDKFAHYGGQGYIQLRDGGIDLISKNTYKRGIYPSAFNITSILDGGIQVKSCFPFEEITEEDGTDVVFQKIFTVLSYKKEGSIVNDGKDNIENIVLKENRRYIGKVKGGNDDQKLYCYLKCRVEEVKIDTIYHINSFHRIKIFDNVNEVLRVGDSIVFDIGEIKGGKIKVTSNAIIEEYADSVIDQDFETIAVVLKVHKNNCASGITKEGYPITIEDFKCEVGNVLKVEIVDYHQNKMAFIVDNIQCVNIPFEGDPILLFRQFLIKAGMIIEKIETIKTNKQNDVNSLEELSVYDATILSRVNLLIHCLEQRLVYLKDQRDVVLCYYVLSVISSITKNSKSYYYTNKLNNLAHIIKLQYDSDLELLDTPEYNSRFGVGYSELQEESLGLSLLNYFNKEELEIPLNIPVNSRFFKLKKLIEANNLLSSYGLEMNTLSFFRSLIIKELSDVCFNDHQLLNDFELSLLEDSMEEKEQIKELTNLGIESKNKEFKTSLFYSASQESQSDVILRSISGFLNSYEIGGSLFIGVSDNGDIKGLQEDLSFTPNVRTLDQYQNYIQSLIASYFSKEVNALIDYYFHKSGKNDYLEIIVPKFDKPVSYKNEFYQRQGVQTRILKGSDLTDFILRKTSHGAIYKTINEVTKNNSNIDLSNINIAQQKELFEQIDFYEDVKESGEIQNRENYEIEEKVLGYLYIFEDNTYMVSKSVLCNYLFMIEITEQYRFGYLLLCYDNACVNKVEIRSILNKTFNKKYMNAISDYGNLMVVYPSLENGEILIETSRGNTLFIKVFDISKISAHKILGLKGNCIVQEDIDKVLRYKYFREKELYKELIPFRRESRQGLGQTPRLSNLDKLLE